MSAAKYLKVVGSIGRGTKSERGNLRGMKPNARLESMSAKRATRSMRSYGSSRHICGSILSLQGQPPLRFVVFRRGTIVAVRSVFDGNHVISVLCIQGFILIKYVKSGGEGYFLFKPI